MAGCYEPRKEDMKWKGKVRYHMERNMPDRLERHVGGPLLRVHFLLEVIVFLDQGSLILIRFLDDPTDP